MLPFLVCVTICLVFYGFGWEKRVFKEDNSRENPNQRVRKRQKSGERVRTESSENPEKPKQYGKEIGE
jgi:hypothetical protein